MPKVKGIKTGKDLLNRLLQLSEEQLNFPVLMYTGWEGPEHLQINSVNVVPPCKKEEGLFGPTEESKKRHILIST
jgi:hypothetical protein